MRTSKRWLMATVVVLGIAAPLAAQDRAPAEFESSRGPGWTFVPGLTFGGTYDSNIALTTAPADTGETVSDNVLFAAPSAQLEYFGRRTEFTTGYRGFMDRYMEVDQLNTFHQRFNVSLRRLASKRVTVYLQNSFADSPTTDDVELNGVPFSRRGATLNTFAGTVDARLTRATDLAVRYDNTWVNFDGGETFLTGGTVNALGVELSRRLNDRSSFGATYGLRLADLNEGTREMTFHDAGGTFRHALAPHTSFSAGAGVSRMEDRLTGDTRTGPYIRTGVIHRAERTTMGASFERQFLPSFGFGGSSQSQEIRGFVGMPILLNRMYIRASAAWRKTDPFVEDLLKLDTVWIRTTLGYALARWLRSEGFYAYTRQDSEVTGGEVDRHRLGVQFVVSQPMRMR